MDILLASNNHGKLERFRLLTRLIDPGIKIYSPIEFGLSGVEVAEVGDTLAQNALLKARAYLGLVEVPVLANDTGLFVAGEGLIRDPKRRALAGFEETDLSEREVCAKVLMFWKTLAADRGGKVDAAWQEAFVVLYPDGKVKEASSVREIILTDQEFGEPHPHMPVRALYYSRATGKPALHHTKEDELLEMEPVRQALRQVLF